MDAAPRALARHRLGLRLGAIARTGWPMAAVGIVGGALLGSLLPVDDGWLAAAVAAALAVLAVGLLATGEVLPAPGGSAPLPRDAAALLERANLAQQLGHALGRAALAVGGVAAGLTLGRLVG